MLTDMIRGLQSDDPAIVEDIKRKDNLVDLLDRQIRLYIARLSSSSLTESQSRRVMTVLEVTRDLENIGDIIDRNIMPIALKRIARFVFSRRMAEIVSFHKKTIENFDFAIAAFANNDRDLAERVLRNKEELGQLERELVQAHLERLRKGLRESIETSHIHLDVIGTLRESIRSSPTSSTHCRGKARPGAGGHGNRGVKRMRIAEWECGMEKRNLGYPNPHSKRKGVIMIKQLRVKSNARTEFVDITAGVQRLVAESGVRSGICHVYVPHTTSAITINENSDPNVGRDILKELNKVIPFDDHYGHSEGNSAAHIKSSLVGVSKAIMIEDGRLALGTSGHIFL
jgi:secondary thiamine-phosphate synthase enzyme